MSTPSASPSCWAANRPRGICRMAHAAQGTERKGPCGVLFLCAGRGGGTVGRFGEEEEEGEEEGRRRREGDDLPSSLPFGKGNLRRVPAEGRVDSSPRPVKGRCDSPHSPRRGEADSPLSPVARGGGSPPGPVAGGGGSWRNRGERGEMSWWGTEKWGRIPTGILVSFPRRACDKPGAPLQRPCRTPRDGAG